MPESKDDRIEQALRNLRAARKIMEQNRQHLPHSVFKNLDDALARGLDALTPRADPTMAPQPAGSAEAKPFPPDHKRRPS